VITIRRARPTDAASIGAVHVEAWRSAYPGILPDDFLARLSVPRQAAHYDSAIRSGSGVHVATASGLDLGASGGPSRIIGFVTGSASSSAKRLAEGEIETLYGPRDRPAPDARLRVTPRRHRLRLGVRVGAAGKPQPLVL
jgi:hypothetical protein